MRRTSMKQHFLLATLALAALPVGWSSHASAEELPASVLACRAEKDDARRLSCFDRETARFSREAADDRSEPPARSAEPAPRAPAASAPVAAAPSPEAAFGFAGGVAPDKRERTRETANALTQMQATVTGISRRGFGELVVTLDNGQVWAELAADPDFDLEVGNQVTIKRASLGSFLMINPSKRSTRVNRLR
jgi:hypothetical protein